MKTFKLFFAGLILIAFGMCSCTTYEFDEPGLLVPLTVTEDPALPSILVNGTQLRAETFGDPKAPMVVAIHGGPGADYESILNFKDLADHGFYVVFYDQRGSGLSERHDRGFYEDKNVQLFIDDLDGVIKHFRNDDDQKVILAGHSWGAMLAAAYINQNTEHVDGAILAEPGGFTWEQTEAYIMRSLGLNPFSENTNDAVIVDQFITGDDHETLDYKMGLFSQHSQTGDDGPLPYRRFGAVLSDWAQNYAIAHPEEMDFTANLSNYQNEILFAYSENNDAYGDEHAKEVSAAFPSVNLEKVEGCGHEIIHFGWDNFFPAVVDYLNQMN